MTSNPFIGIGLRHPHYDDVLNHPPTVDWFEVHSENFFLPGSPIFQKLLIIREQYPISLHGVGLSLGSADGLDPAHLKRLWALMMEIQPFLISEHLSWNRYNRIAVPDLLPLPYHRESLDIICQNVEFAQTFLKRELLIENPSSYLEFEESTFSEMDFLVALCQRTGAKILLDVNNIYVSCMNHGWDAKKYLEAIPKELVKEIHVAGHSQKIIEEGKVLRVDTHDNIVCDEVWELYRLAIARIGKVPTLLEWDANIPPLDVLVREAKKALNYLPMEAHAVA